MFLYLLIKMLDLLRAVADYRKSHWTINHKICLVKLLGTTVLKNVVMFVEVDLYCVHQHKAEGHSEMKYKTWG